MALRHEGTDLGFQRFVTFAQGNLAFQVEDRHVPSTRSSMCIQTPNYPSPGVTWTRLAFRAVERRSARDHGARQMNLRSL